ncbi:MAG: hypothetical protein AB1611_03640 [bacterium]
MKTMKKMLVMYASCGLVALLAGVLTTYIPSEATVHDTHLRKSGSLDPRDPRGANLTCTDCHQAHGCSNGAPGMLKDCLPLAQTTICDPCHSPGGAFDGANDPVIGAKAHWRDGGVYDSGQGRQVLKPGLENWCAGCHDDGNATCLGVSAPNVMGDNATYGYNITGHKIACTSCHNAAGRHMDGQARTYTHDSNPWDTDDSQNYQNGYRLAARMIIPLFTGPQAGTVQDRYALCYGCHDFAKLLGATSPYQTNFQDDSINRHVYHLSSGRTAWDSDWDYLQVPDEIIIDNTGAAFSGEGWQIDNTLTGYYGTDYAWHLAGSGSCTAAWTPQIPMNRAYKVYVRWPVSSSWASDAQYTIVYNGGSIVQTLNQQIGGGMWNLLGSFSFIQGTSGYVQLSDLASGPVAADAVRFGDPIMDSRISCPACHNVHGSSDPAMIRHGELISTPGTQDKSPALSFRWYKEDGYTPTIFGDESRFGDMPVLGGVGGGNLEDSKVCAGCHAGPAPIKYDRVYQTVAMPQGSWAKPSLPPSVRLLTPGPGSSEVAVDTNLSFLLLSNGENDLDLTSVTISLTGTLSYSQTYHFGDSPLVITPVSGRSQCYTVVVNPECNFGDQETITVTISAQDIAGHSLTSPSWSFEAGISSPVIWRSPMGVHSESLFYSPERLIDDHPETENVESPFPDHWVIYDLGQSCQVGQIRLLLSSSSVRLWTIWVGDDPAAFGSAVKTDWPAAVTGDPPELPQWVSTSFPPVQGRYLKIFTGRGYLSKDTIREIDFAEN